LQQGEERKIARMRVFDFRISQVKSGVRDDLRRIKVVP
jgi:hypothetical protein